MLAEARGRALREEGKTLVRRRSECEGVTINCVESWNTSATGGGKGKLSFLEKSALGLTREDVGLVGGAQLVTMSFGMRNVPREDWAELIKSVHGLLEPKGVWGILEVCDPTKEVNPTSASFLRFLAKNFVDYVVPIIGGIVSGGHFNEYFHLQKSIGEFPAPDEFQKIIESLQDANFRMVTRETFNFDSINLWVFVKQ